MMNVLEGITEHPCTSCQMCGAVCPKDAISISLDKEGFYRPTVDGNLCIDCGLCTRFCYKFDGNIKQTSNEDLEHTRLFAAAAKDDWIISNTTSGGIADLLAASLIRKGYNVIGASYKPETNIVVHEVAKTQDKANSFRGSKYIQSYSYDAFKELVKGTEDEQYAVFGLPCQIYAISKYLEHIHKRDKCVLIDLYCHGCPSMLVWDKVSETIKQQLQAEAFSSVNWRSKHRGWGSFVLEVKADNGKYYVSRPLSNEFFDLFFSNQLLNESCNDCKLRGTLAYTDIRLGDFWGKEYDKTFRGVSGVSVVTEKGESVFSGIKDEINVTEKEYSTFLPFQSWNHVYQVNQDLRMQLMELLQDDNTTLSQCFAPITKRRSSTEMIKLIVKQILCFLPGSIERRIRRIIK